MRATKVGKLRFPDVSTFIWPSAAWGSTEDSEVREVLGEFGSDVCGKINESLKAVKNF